MTAAEIITEAMRQAMCPSTGWSRAWDIDPITGDLVEITGALFEEMKRRAIAVQTIEMERNGECLSPKK